MAQSAEDPAIEEMRQACAAVGELILITSALDNQLNHICIAVLTLAPSPMLEPVVASLDSSRKVEMLKAFADKLSSKDWKSGLKHHLEMVEKVNRWRNIAAHSTLTFENGKAVLHSPAAAKLIKSMDLKRRTAKKMTVAEFEAAIRKAEEALESGDNLLSNFVRVAAERDRRNAAG